MDIQRGPNLVNCPLCHMTFTSTSLLNKHRRDFCLGYQHESNWRAASQQQKRIDTTEPLESGNVSRASTSSMSIYLPDDDDYPSARKDLEREYRKQQLQKQAQNHGKNLSDLRNRNENLKQQRDEINQRLANMRGSGGFTEGEATQLLTRLREQDRRNQRNLNELRRQLQETTGAKPMSPRNTLAAEISAMRHLYLKQGGADPGILAQMSDMEIEARGQGNKRDKPKKSKVKPQEQLLALELENEKLQRELSLMDHRSSSRIYDEAVNRQLKHKQEEYLRRLTDLEQEIELIRQRAKLERYKKELDEIPQAPTPRQLPPPNIPAQLPALMAAGDVPALMNHPAGHADQWRAIQQSHYDPSSGFVVFYDFILGLDPTISSLRLVVSLVNRHGVFGEPTILPPVLCEPDTSGRYGAYQSTAAVLGTKQPVPHCNPSPELKLVVEVQAASGSVYSPSPTLGPSQRLTTRAWAKFDLFTEQQQLLSGYWKVPLRQPPISFHLSNAEVHHTIPQFGTAELFVRFVNYRDMMHQNQLYTNPNNAGIYQIPPQVPYGYPGRIPPIPLDHSKPMTPYLYAQHNKPGYRDIEYVAPSHYQVVSFQVDRVRRAESGEGKVRITAYHRTTGKIVQTAYNPMTCTTTAVRSTFKRTYHVFGQQEAVFKDVSMDPNIVLLVRFYLKKRLNERFPKNDRHNGHTTGDDQRLYQDELLTAWATMPLFYPHNDYNKEKKYIDVGTHVLRLYKPPVPEPGELPLSAHPVPQHWARYGRANVRIHISQGKPTDDSLPPSDVDSDEEDDCPKDAWLPNERSFPPSEHFGETDGFDIYIDSCRFLPDSVTISRVAGRIVDKNYEKIGNDINTSVKLNSNIYNPVYEHRTEVRADSVPHSATLYLKVYTVDKFYQQFTAVGHAVLNVFVETGTEKQPTSDSANIQVSLNEGAHQLRLYSRGPTGTEPMNESCLRDSGQHPLPCASLLVRLVKAQRGSQGKVLESEHVPEADWRRLGLWQTRPSYGDQVYLSLKCAPSRGECQIFHTLVQRPPLTIKEAVSEIRDSERELKNGITVSDFIKSQLRKMLDTIPLPQDITFVAQYSPKHGIKIAIDRAMNLPWSNFTHGIICLNPPGALYMGQSATYDKPIFTKYLDLNSTDKCPQWKDGFYHFRNRSYHKYLALIIHLQEITVTLTDDSYKYALVDQAWTAVSIFREGYANTTAFQLPLFHGSPNEGILQELARRPLHEWTAEAIERGRISLVDNASVFVRVCDARRDAELSTWTQSSHPVEINQDFLPQNTNLDGYAHSIDGTELLAMVPQTKDPNDFVDTLATRFKSLVYKLYDAGQLSDDPSNPPQSLPTVDAETV